jgi:hypothetical protein
MHLKPGSGRDRGAIPIRPAHRKVLVATSVERGGQESGHAGDPVVLAGQGCCSAVNRLFPHTEIMRDLFAPLETSPRRTTQLPTLRLSPGWVPHITLLSLQDTGASECCRPGRFTYFRSNPQRIPLRISRGPARFARRVARQVGRV